MKYLFSRAVDMAWDILSKLDPSLRLGELILSKIPESWTDHAD